MEKKLTIKNYDKIIGCVVGNYQVAQVRQLSKLYEIAFRGNNRRYHKIVTIYREPLSEYEQSVYKVVCSGRWTTIWKITLNDKVATLQYISHWLENLL
jgi:hypothetical protein